MKKGYVVKAWRFDQQPNCGVITTKDVMNKKNDILYVFHDEDDHGWQFLSANSSDEDFALVTLQQIVDIDSSVKEIANIHPGWKASRKSKDDEWVIEQNH